MLSYVCMCALCSVGGIGCNGWGRWCGHTCDDEWISILPLPLPLLFPSIAWVSPFAHKHTLITVLCWHETSGHCLYQSATHLTSLPLSMTQVHKGHGCPDRISPTKTWCLVSCRSVSSQPLRDMTAFEMHISAVVTLTRITVNYHFVVRCNNSIASRFTRDACCVVSLGWSPSAGRAVQLCLIRRRWTQGAPCYHGSLAHSVTHALLPEVWELW